MSVTVAPSKRRVKPRLTPWESPAAHTPASKCGEMITIRQDDPFQSLAQPGLSIGQQLDAELDRLTQLTAELREQVTEPVASTVKPTTGRTGARDAWCAVVIMGLFIAAGITWTSTRLADAKREVASLTQQIEEKETAIIHYQQEIKRLRQELLAARLQNRPN